MNKLVLSLVSRVVKILPTWIKSGLYRLGPFSSIIRWFLNKMSPPGLTQVTIAGGELQGKLIYLDLQMEKDYWLGTYENDLQVTIRELVKPGWVAYDVGANIGYISLLFSRVIGENGFVYAFEANPNNIERLRENLDLNRLTHRVKVIPAAVIDTSRRVTFLIGPSGAMGKVNGSAGRSGVHRRSIEVQGVALDDFIYLDGNHVPQVIKMDIEGGEILAFAGMSRLLEQARPLILLELHGQEAAQVAWDGLTRADYRISGMKRGFPPVHSVTDLDWKAYLVAMP